MPGALPPKTLVLETFFSGRVLGEGVFVNAWTRSRRGLSVDILPSWDGRVLTLDEHFVYSNGETEHKVWRLEQEAAGIFSGTREDVVGLARIWTDGRTLRLRYVLRLAGIAFSFSETMIYRDDGSVYGRAGVRKWGIPIGKVELVMRRA